jgi:hypothetical protein
VQNEPSSVAWLRASSTPTTPPGRGDHGKRDRYQVAAPDARGQERNEDRVHPYAMAPKTASGRGKNRTGRSGDGISRLHLSRSWFTLEPLLGFASEASCRGPVPCRGRVTSDVTSLLHPRLPVNRDDRTKVEYWQ